MALLRDVNKKNEQPKAATHFGNLFVIYQIAGLLVVDGD